MTREILFKAVSIGGKWVEGDLVTLYRPIVQKHIARKGNNQNWRNTEFVEVHPDTVCEFTGFVTAGKKIKVFDGDKWELHCYSILTNGYVRGAGIIKRQSDGMWICQGHLELNSYDLITMIAVYKGAFEITGNIHDGRVK